jgi:hypothetical protein
MTFTVTRLANSRALVKGTDYTGTDGEQVLNTHQLDELDRVAKINAAQSEFDTAVEDFFAPLMAAAEKAEKAGAQTEDTDFTYVVSEGSEGVQAEERKIVKLWHDSVVLRLIATGKQNRLVWVAGELEIIEASAPAPTAPVPNPSVYDDEV